VAAQDTAHKFVHGTYALYQRLLLLAFLDGSHQFSRETGSDPVVPDDDRQRAIRLLLLYYLPGLVKLHNEALHISLTAPDKPAALNAWFDKNRKRLETAIEGLLWSASEAGYAATAQAADRRVDWMLDGGADHCPDCPAIADSGPYTFSTLPGYPGSGISVCGARCRCWLSVVSTPALASAQA